MSPRGRVADPHLRKLNTPRATAINGKGIAIEKKKHGKSTDIIQLTGGITVFQEAKKQIKETETGGRKVKRTGGESHSSNSPEQRGKKKNKNKLAPTVGRDHESGWHLEAERRRQGEGEGKHEKKRYREYKTHLQYRRILRLTETQKGTGAKKERRALIT